MSAPVFRLRVPVDLRYRSLATEVVTRYLDLIGKSEPEQSAVASAFGRALDELVDAPDQPEASAGQVEVLCLGGAAGGELHIRSGTKSAVVRYPGSGTR